MHSTKIPGLCVAALLAACFGVAASLDIWFQSWPGSRTQSSDMLSVLIGDGRRLFANHFFVKADAYFHSGYYPTVFDNREAFQTPHLAEDSGAVAGKNHGDETAFMGKPRDWIEKVSRHLMPATHTHLDQGGTLKDLGDSSEVREILPWLELSAELDPNNIDTYTVTAYWLRRMGKVTEAEQFLREGLRENPGSYEILFELGSLFAENHHDTMRARNLWGVAWRNWQKSEAGKPEPDKFVAIHILSRLATLEVRETNYTRALSYMEMWKKESPTPDAVQKQIDEIRKLASPERRPSVTDAKSEQNPVTRTTQIPLTTDGPRGL